MKRSRVDKCYICTGKWSERKFHAEKREFDKLAPERSVSTNSPLTGSQKDFLRKHFCGHDGRFDTFCIKHCEEFASICRNTVGNLQNEFARAVPGEDFDLDNPPPIKHRRIAVNAIPSETISLLKNWCFTNSSVVPNSLKVRRLNAPLTSKTRAYHKFQEDNSAVKIGKSSFLAILKERFPNFKVKY